MARPPDPPPRVLPPDPAARLLDRPPPPRYLEAWTRSLTRAVVPDRLGARFSALLVRVGVERYALPGAWVTEVHRVPVIRRLPGRGNEVFVGLAGLRGEITLCAALGALLGVPGDGAASARQRLVGVARDGERWALLVDEVLGVETFETDHVQAAQATVARSAVHYSDGVVPTAHGPAARLDGARLFAGLARSLEGGRP